MASSEKDTILITTSLSQKSGAGLTERGLRDAISGASMQTVSVRVLKESMERFLDQLREILSPGADKIGEFEISQVEVSAQISGDGQVSLLGSGLKVGVNGGVSFILKRSADQ